LDSIILAGGFATRLRPLTLTRPKPLLPILDKPLLDWILSDLFMINSLNKVMFSLHNMADQIMSHVKNRWFSYGDKLEYFIEEKPLGDGGALINVIKDLRDKIDYPLLVLNGDLFMQIDYQKVINYHEKRGGLMTIVGTYVDDVSKYGFLKISDNDVLSEIIEKPKDLVGREGFVNAGVYILSEESVNIILSDEDIIKKSLDYERKISIAKDLIPLLIRKGDVYVYRHDGLWIDIGSPGDYFKANIHAIKILCGKNTCADPTAELDSDVKIEDPVFIGRNVRIKNGSVIGSESILMNDVYIGRGVYIENSLIMNNTHVEDYSIIRGAIIGENNRIGRWARIYRETVLGSSIYIGDHICLPPKTKVLPYKEINEDICLKYFTDKKEGDNIII